MRVNEHVTLRRVFHRWVHQRPSLSFGLSDTFIYHVYSIRCYVYGASLRPIEPRSPLIPLVQDVCCCLVNQNFNENPRRTRFSSKSWLSRIRWVREVRVSTCMDILWSMIGLVRLHVCGYSLVIGEIRIRTCRYSLVSNKRDWVPNMYLLIGNR